MSANKRWIQSFSGKVITPTYLDPNSVRLADICRGLSEKTRFQGQALVRGYTVGQHSLEGVRRLPPAFRLPFLLHEVSEVYLPDVPGPMKDLVYVDIGGAMVPWSKLEAQHADAIMTALGLEGVRRALDWPEVKRMDWVMLATEKRDLCGAEPEDWNLPHGPDGLAIREILSGPDVEDLFITTFDRLAHD